MSRIKTNDTMPKMGHVTDLREQWLVRADGALAHHLQDREISTHLCENRFRNQQIREDFPVALSEQRDIEHEVRLREMARHRQAEIDAEIAREMAEINLRRQRRKHSTDLIQQPCSSRALPQIPKPVNCDIDPEELGLSPAELEEMKNRLEQEEKDARLARELSHEVHDHDILLADMRCAVEAQDGELARLLQEREYKKLQRAKEKARQKALLKKQQRLAAKQQQDVNWQADPRHSQATLCDAYSNPKDLIGDLSRTRLCKSVDSDLNYVEPFEKECIQSKASALQAKQISSQYYAHQQPGTSNSNANSTHAYSRSFESESPLILNNNSSHHRQPPPPPTSGKKPRFPDPVSIRPASHYPTDNIQPHNNVASDSSLPHSYSSNNNHSNTFPVDQDGALTTQISHDTSQNSKRFSVISDITSESSTNKKIKQAEMQRKRKGCKIQ